MAVEKKRGRPRIHMEISDSYAKTGIIRKPTYLLKKQLVDSKVPAIASSSAKRYFLRSSPVDSSTDSDSVNESESDQQSSPLTYTSIKEPVSKVFISVEGFKKRGPKPGQKRNKYKKRKQATKRPKPTRD